MSSPHYLSQLNHKLTTPANKKGDIMKLCIKCQKHLPKTEFHKVCSNKNHLRSYCKACDKEVRKGKFGRIRSRSVRAMPAYERLYGLTEYEYAQMLVNQCNLCKICGIEFGSNTGNPVCVDHCHATGKVRGLLCRHCNSMLGFARDDLNILKSGIIYLQLS